MAKLTFRIIIFFIPIILILGYVELQLRKIPNNFNKKRTYFESQAKDLEVLVLGNSEAWYGINPEYFSYKGFNLAYASQPVYYDIEITKKYLDELKNLKTVIMSITYISLSYDLYDTKENWRDFYYHYFWNVSYPKINYYDSRYFSLISLYGNKNVFKYAVNENFKVDLSYNINKNGWVKIIDIGDSTLINDSIGKEVVKQYEIDYFYDGRFEINCERVYKFIELLQKRNINVVVLMPPVHPTFQKFTNKKHDAKIDEFFKHLKTNLNVNTYNYLNDKRFNIDEFCNTQHLNYRGAEKFSKIINDEILIPYFSSVSKGVSAVK